MSSEVPVFLSVPATNPTTAPAVPAETFDQWFVYHIAINQQTNGKFSLESFWREGNLITLGEKTTSYAVHDLLAPETLIANPEIAQIAPQFMSALAAIGYRKGVL